MVTRHSIREQRKGRFRVLVVEDNPVNQQVAMKLLHAHMDCYADAVDNGVQAIEALGRANYDLVLMDCQMPEMDGYEATKAIRDPQTPVRDHDIPIVAMTAHAMQGDREECLAVGMNDYIAKPLYPDEFIEIVQRNLRKKAPTL